MPDRRGERRPLLPHENVEVWPIIHMIRGDVIHYIDTPLTYDALTAPDLTYTLIRPLEEKYNAIQRSGNKSVVFCLLLNRTRFIRDQNLTTKPLSSTRAALCEILAIRVLRDNGSSTLDLALTLTTSWNVWSGADPHTIEMAREERDDDVDECVGNAIEVAIISKSRRFIKSGPCQRVIDSIWVGKVVYQASSNHSIISDTYKRNPIHWYDPHKAPLLDHYRLKVPAIRSVLEYINFLGLFVLFIVAIEMNERHRLNPWEVVFMVYGLGFALEKAAAMQEHGIKVFFKGTWNGFDLAFVTAYYIYAFLRVYGVVWRHHWAQSLGIDFLAVIACLMFPRLAFVTLRNNLMVLSLRAMMVQFVALMMIAAFCFAGFLYALWTLSRKEAMYSASQIAWWMLDLWFGLDASGFDRATQFDYHFGPVLMITYACLSNTLLLTVLVSILSNTFAKINDDAAAEAMFRKAVSTIEGVKADSLFSYQPPINILALCILYPSSYILTPRWFHKVNVFLIRLTNFPVLLLIALYERQSKRSGSVGFYDTVSSVIESVFESLPRSIRRLGLFDGLAGSAAGIDLIFDIEEDMDDSALDLQDVGDLNTIEATILQRRATRKSDRTSHSSGRRPPTPRKQSQGNGSSSGLQVPAQRPGPSPVPTNASSTAPTTAPVVPRRRLLSQVGRDITHSVSPLAQVFQPVIMDDDIPEGEAAEMLQGMQAPLVSYGPASRRRLMSLQSVRRPVVAGDAQSQQSGVSMPLRSPTSDAGRRDLLMEGAVSMSPDQQEGHAEPETVTQAEESPELSNAFLVRKLQQMEERHKRMEDLLVRLHAGLTKDK